MNKNNLDDINFMMSYLRYLSRRGDVHSAAWAKLILVLTASLDHLKPNWRSALVDMLNDEGIDVSQRSLFDRQITKMTEGQLFKELIDRLKSNHPFIDKEEG